MNFFSRWIEQQGREITTQPLVIPVKGMQDAYIETEGLRKLGWRVLRRKLYLWANRQFQSYRHEIDPGWRKGLWIYFRTAQIGDSLMDLSARSFFVEKNCHIDLLTSPLLAQLYQDDDWFQAVHSDLQSMIGKDYDFIVVQSMHHSALKMKVKHFPDLPWICMQGFYDVPDFDRAPWGAQRLFDLYGELKHPLRNWHGRQKLSARYLTPLTTKFRTTIVLGGMDPVRTFDNWPDVVKELVGSIGHEVTLIGTGTAAAHQANQIKSLRLSKGVIDLVNQINIHELIQILSETKLLLVADGGAMHLGVALQVPQIISLFIKGIPPDLRIPDEHRSLAITSQTGFIRDISTADVMAKIHLAISNDGMTLSNTLNMRQ